jgi:hypothetical protein
VKQVQAAAAGLALLTLIGTGCSANTPPLPRHTPTTPASVRAATPAPSRSRCTSARRFARASPARRSAPGLWPQRLIESQRPSNLVSGEVINPASDTYYTLTSRTHTPMRGPYVLACTDLRTGAVHEGPTFPVGSLTAASGYLWVYGAPRPGSRPLIYQVNPGTLARIRLLPPPPGHADFGAVSFAEAPGDSMWIGYDRTLLRLAVSTGAALTRATLPPGLTVTDIAVDPARATLYVSAAHVVRGGMEGLVMLEYAARSGHRLPGASGGLLRYSVAGAGLTAVPGGVWVSFRTGMLGLTIHLRRSGLRMIAPPGPGIALRPATGVFHWAMSAAAAYGGGALWLANLRVVACLDPQTGKVRASERVGQSPKPPSQLITQLAAIDPITHTIYGPNGTGLVQVIPPRQCWR